MKTIKIPNKTIDLFRELFDASLPSFNDFQWQINKDILKGLYNITEEKAPQTLRGEVRNKEIRQEIISALDDLDINRKFLTSSYINFARGFLPIAIHVDIPANSTSEDGDTILIPLTFDDKIKTFWWKNNVHEPIFDYWIEKQDWTKREKINNLREQYDIRNGYFFKQEVIDYMELDGIGEWFKGSCFCGRRSQPHCSSNFKASGIAHKDYILLQTTDIK
jgi:hypothetical protein